MLKRIYILLLALILASCQTSGTRYRPSSVFTPKPSPIEEAEMVTPESFRVGVLLPLSGEAAAAGQGLKNAAMLALEDMGNQNLILQFYDTKSSPEGARIAAENAINQGVKLIVGPLMSTEVEAVSPISKRSNVPVVAFSTNEKVLQPQVYTLGLLVGEQIERIISYATMQGRGRFALLLPDNSTGIVVARETMKAVNKNGGRVVKIAFYPPETNDFSSIVKSLTNYSGVAENETGESKHGRRLDFDAVLIPETGSRLKSATAMFGYYDVFSPDVMFLGTSVWENTKLNKETTLNKAVYPTLSRNYSAYFNKKYHSLYGVYPNALSAFGYDAVALASSLSKKNTSNLDAAITSADGFSGINGTFRIFANGKNQHSIDVMQITPKGDIVIDAAQRSFVLPATDVGQMMSFSDMPIILGKSVEEFRTQVFEE
ncbi:MAG: penicillin-binding protein activator [Alphaproteobacteria bacterium]|nr:penicillin-binding protein activator [Alphaproteobacteria bacterium]